MSDYFGALLRSAGARPSAGRVGTPIRVDAPEPTAPEVALEQTLEVPSALDATAPVQPPARVAPRDEAPDRQAASAASPFSGRPGSSSMAPGDPRPSAPNDDASAFSAAAAEGPVHPLVQAALRWVRAEATPDDAPRHGRPPEPPSEPESHAAAAAPRRPRQLPVRAAESDPKGHSLLGQLPQWTPDRDAPGQKTEARAMLDLELSHALRRAPIVGRPGTGSPGDPAHSAPQPPIELSIGTIHVTVDAPAPPRPAPSAAAPAARPAATARPAASRSDFTRARLPRSL